MIVSALERHLKVLKDPIPLSIRKDLCLPELSRAIRRLHSPARTSSIDQLNTYQTIDHRRIRFDRFFMVMLSMAFRKKIRENRLSPSFNVSEEQAIQLKSLFPFSLTRDQSNAVNDIIQDFHGPKPMNRLIMGDVGCGKTVLAALCAAICVQNHYQAAVMVPTQVLAGQHLDTFSNLPPELGIRPVLLAGRLKRKEREDIYEKIQNNTYNLVIGTQSLIQKHLIFSKLGLVIIDEQHRFGVRERALMDQKGDNPHLLVMTATPIPRTLAIAIYGDMDISLIKEFPRGHRPVITRVAAKHQKREVFDALQKTLSKGNQAIVVCPVIESSEESDLKDAVEMTERLTRTISPPYRVGLVHGRLSHEDRDQVMEAFRNGSIQILVGTSLLEVGIHVPRATLMIIEHPERFGLAQLHQLRGRVGRGFQQGLCVLMAADHLQEKSLARLQALAEIQDGFQIAQKDLELRGHGELVGMRQSGFNDVDFSEMVKDPDQLIQAKEAAQQLVAKDPSLSDPRHRQIRAAVESLLSVPLDL
jgi:ATP-dependent DNA helicase RecG